MHMNLYQIDFFGGLQCLIRKLENDKQVCKVTKMTPSSKVFCKADSTAEGKSFWFDLVQTVAAIC